MRTVAVNEGHRQRADALIANEPFGPDRMIADREGELQREGLAHFIATIEAETLAAQARRSKAALDKLIMNWRKWASCPTSIEQDGLRNEQAQVDQCADELEAALAQPAPAATPPATIKATLIPAGPLKMGPITEDDLAGSPPAATEGMLSQLKELQFEMAEHAKIKRRGSKLGQYAERLRAALAARPVTPMTTKPASEPPPTVTDAHHQRVKRWYEEMKAYFAPMFFCPNSENLPLLIAAIEAETLAAQAGGREAAQWALVKKWSDMAIDDKQQAAAAGMAWDETHLLQECAEELKAALAQPAPAATPPALTAKDLAAPMRRYKETGDDNELEREIERLLASKTLPAATEGMLSRDPGWEKRAAEWVRERIAELNDSLADLGQP